MSFDAASLVAWSGLYAYAAIFYAAVYASRRRQEIYRLIAGFLMFLAVFSLSGGLSIRATSPGDAVTFQSLQIVGLLAAVAFLLDFVTHLTDSRRPALCRAAYLFAASGAVLGCAGMFFDPVHPHPQYDWSLGSVTASAEVTALGRVFVLGAVAISTYATAHLVLAARLNRHLRIAAVAAAAAAAGGVVDSILVILRAPPIHLTSHLAVLPVLAYSYVLIGRFTGVEAKLEVLTEELRQSYDHRRHAQEEIVKTEQLAAVGELSAVIAHEVRNPLAILKNSVGGLRQSAIEPDDAKTLLEILDSETDRLNRLVSDFLAYARPISPKPDAHVDLRLLVGHAVELAAAGTADIARVELELDLSQEIRPVAGDEALLRHALINIVDNALQAMPDGGTLSVSCRATEIDGRPCSAVDFLDTGEGMDTMVRSRARDPFFTTRQKGTGLGLAIVERVAAAHGGRVEIESRHGLGTTVSLVLPCVDATGATST